MNRIGGGVTDDILQKILVGRLGFLEGVGFLDGGKGRKMMIQKGRISE